MRPKLLEIEGLQSFKELQRIDFETLSETGLFGIFGPTGSGKSTILDAITFALYGRVERASRGTQGIIHANMNHVRVSFTFELKKGSRVKKYRVERVYRRKKDTAACEPRIARLIEIDEAGEIPLSDKATEVSAKVEELIGLNHDDFIRAVVLPQNRFQEFLMLDTAKRREMLERIFYLEEYGQQLIDKVRKKADSLGKRLDHARGVLSELGDASDDAVEESGRRLNAALEDRNKEDRNWKSAETRYQEAKELWQLMQDMELLIQQEQVHASRKEEMDAKKAALQKALRAEELIGRIRKHRETAMLLEKTRKELSGTEEMLPVMAAEMEKVRKQQEEARIDAESRRPALMESRTRLTDALSLLDTITEYTGKLKGMTGKLGTFEKEMQSRDGLIQKKKLELVRTDKKLADIRSELNALTVDPDYRQAMHSGASLQEELQAAERESRSCLQKSSRLQDKINRLKKQEKELSGQTEKRKREIRLLTEKKDKLEQAKPGDRSACLQRNQGLNRLQILCVELKRAMEDIVSFQKKEKELLADRKEASRRKEEAARRLKTAEEAVESCKSLAAERERVLGRHSAYLLSRNLKEGEPCPVCGSLHHPQLAETVGDTDILSAEREIAAARDRLGASEEGMHAIEKELLILEEQIRNRDAALEQVRAELSEAEEEYREKVLGLPEEFQSFLPDGKITGDPVPLSPLSSPLLSLQNHIGQKLNRVAEELKAIDAWEKASREIQDRIQGKNAVLSETNTALGSIAAERRVNEENLSQVGKEAEEASRKWKEKKEAFADFLKVWPVESPSAELKRIADKDRKLRDHSREADRLQQAVQAGREKLDKLTEERNELGRQAAALEIEEKNMRWQLSDLEGKVRQVAPDGRVREGIRRIDAQLDAFTQAEKQFRERQESLRNRYQEQVTKQSTLKNQKEIYAQDYDREETELRTARAERGFSDDMEAEKAVLSKEEQQRLDRECKGYRQAADNLQAQRRILENKRKGRTITEEEWAGISGQYREAAERKESSAARYEVEKAGYEALTKKHLRWVAWSGLQEKLSGKQGRLEQIQKLLKGDKGKDNSFVDYIAEERLRYVAAKASEILGGITRYKYALELDINEGFIIRDNGNGGISRMVSSLSGGEIFLTSLSLALALSEQIQLKGQSPLEFFFLDEGFGTLDTQLLDTVMDSLERLSTRERVIGLISHVPELKDRIARRLIVDPPTSRGDGSRVRIEKA